MLREQRDEIFESFITETYDGNPEPESLKEFRDSYKKQKELGLKDDVARHIAASNGLMKRATERKMYHDNKGIEKMNKSLNPDDLNKEMEKGTKQEDRLHNSAKKALNRAKKANDK